MRKAKLSLLTLSPILTMAVLSGCASSPEPRYFILEAPVASPPERVSDKRIMVGPVSIPEHLDRRGITSRGEQGLVTVKQFDRWSESLDQNIASVVTEILRQKRGPKNSTDYYANFSADHDYAVRINIIKFGRMPENQVSLSASWQIRDTASTSKTTYSRTFSQPVLGARTEDTVSAMNSLLVELANAVDLSIPS